MASKLDRFGSTPYRAQGIPNINVPSYGRDTTKGMLAARQPQLRGIARKEGSPNEERTLSMQRQAAADRAASQENADVRQSKAQARMSEQAAKAGDDATLLRLGQMSRGDLPEQIAAREAKAAEQDKNDQRAQLRKFEEMADLAKMTGEANLNPDGYRELGPEANQILAKMTGRSNLSIQNEGEESPKLAVRLVGDPQDPTGNGHMQFFLKGKDGYQPLTMANGRPVQPMLGFINQATALVDKVRNYELAGGKAPDAKGYTDLQKESMSNQSANARTEYEQAVKLYNETMTNNPDNLPAMAAANEAVLLAQKKLAGAGEGFSAIPGQTDPRQGASFMLAPDFDREGKPYRPVRSALAAAPAAPGAAAAAAPQAQTYPARETPPPNGQPTYTPRVGGAIPMPEQKFPVNAQTHQPVLPAMNDVRAREQAGAMALQNLQVHQDPARYAQEQRAFYPTPEQIAAEQRANGFFVPHAGGF